MKSILIHGGTIVNEGRRFRGWVLVSGDLISEVGEGDFVGEFAGERIDATGKIVIPGVIDAHVHFREPGLTAKGDMETESRAAVAGGVTSVLEMPNTLPPAVDCDTLERKFDLAAGRMHTNYSFYLGATTDNLPEIKRYYNRGGRLVKLFAGSSTGGMLVDDARATAALFAEFGGVVAAHCEDEATIRANSELFRRSNPRGPAAIHPLVRSEEACYRSTARTVELADRYGARLHVCHLTTARELSLFGEGPVAAKRITAEACIPHLWFSDEDYARLGNLIKCNPAIKTSADREALRGALRSGRIDTVATDHAPHLLAEKLRDYWDAPSGMPSVQFSVPVMFSLAARGIVTLEEVVERMCHAPATIFNIAGRGFLRAGYHADITIIDPASPWIVTSENILSKCGWSPLEGERFSSHVAYTIINGHITYGEEGVSPEIFGERLVFDL
jgi:dihydroorotase